MSAYLDELTKAMTLLGEQPNALFLGQNVVDPGQPMHGTFAGVSDEKKLELPVCEEMQMGMSTGLALEGFLSVSVFPRWNFLLLAANQLVNHLDRLPLYSDYRPKVIIRTAVGRSQPLDPGPQHQDDFTETFRRMLLNTRVEYLSAGVSGLALSRYKGALHRDRSTLIVENGNEY